MKQSLESASSDALFHINLHLLALEHAMHWAPAAEESPIGTHSTKYRYS
jgi:hypothetical protein